MNQFVSSQNIEPGYWVPHEGSEYRYSKASSFRSSMSLRERQNKAVAGLLIGLTSPDKSGAAYGIKYITSSIGTKRAKTSIGTNYSFILVFADMNDLPNCFALVLHKKSDFQNMFNAIANCETITLGDAFLFIEPVPCDDKLGEEMIVLKSPNRTSLLKRTPDWPVHDLLVSSDKDRQVAFHAKNKIIEVYSPILRVGMHNVLCSHATCDRQNIKCRGCFGIAPTRFPIVLECDIVVKDCPNYDTKHNEAEFVKFRSFRFSNLFFDSLEDLSSKPYHDIDTLSMTLRNNLTSMVDHINNHDGWTITGWHRRGVFDRGVDGEETLASNTAGHIVYLMPSNPKVINDNTFKANKIKTTLNPQPTLASKKNHSKKK